MQQKFHSCNKGWIGSFCTNYGKLRLNELVLIEKLNCHLDRHLKCIHLFQNSRCFLSFFNFWWLYLSFDNRNITWYKFSYGLRNLRLQSLDLMKTPNYQMPRNRLIHFNHDWWYTRSFNAFITLQGQVKSLNDVPDYNISSTQHINVQIFDQLIVCIWISKLYSNAYDIRK